MRSMNRIQQYPTLREAAESLEIDSRTLRRYAKYKDSEESQTNQAESKPGRQGL